MNQPRRPALFDSAPTREQIAHVLVVLDQPIRYAPDTSSPSSVRLSPRFEISMVLVAVSLAIPLGILAAFWAIPSAPNPPLFVTIMCLFAVVGAYMLIAAINEYGKRLLPYVEIDTTSGRISLPRYETTIDAKDIWNFTTFTSTYFRNEDAMECTQFGVVARTSDGQFGYYDLAPVTSLDLRRVLRKLYSVPHWSYVEDDHGRPRFLKAHDA